MRKGARAAGVLLLTAAALAASPTATAQATRSCSTPAGTRAGYA
ncbi:hypothetical protein ACWDRB_59595 [Nonomuraea sp. NPDC003707]